MEHKTAETVVKVFAILNWVGAALALLGGVMLILVGANWALTLPGTDSALGLFLAPIMGFISILLGAASALVGWGLWTHKNWARIMVIILSALTVLSFPIGTIIALLQIWLFGFDKDVKALFGA